MSEKIKQTVLKILVERENTWVPQNLLQKLLNKDERFAPAISQLREEGHNIANRYATVGGKQMWEYMLVREKNKGVPGWYCSKCSHRVAPADMKSNTLSEKHSHNYCASCAKRALFVLR